MLDEVKSNNKIILVIDEIHTLVGAGAAEGAAQGSIFLFPQCTPFPQTLSILAPGGGRDFELKMVLRVLESDENDVESYYMPV